MPKIQRIFLDHLAASLKEDVLIEASASVSHYLSNVLRLKIGDSVTVFDGKGGGDFIAIIEIAEKKRVILKVIEATKPHTEFERVTLAFAVIKKTPVEYLIQKATEIGTGVLQPVITEYTAVKSFGIERARIIAIEAAEQCGLTAVPEIKQPVSLVDYMRGVNDSVLFCDESGTGAPILSVCSELKRHGKNAAGILIGPEGGFSPVERVALRKNEFFLAVDLGKRILRAETAALAALSIRAAVDFSN